MCAEHIRLLQTTCQLQLCQWAAASDFSRGWTLAKKHRRATAAGDSCGRQRWATVVGGSGGRDFALVALVS